ncbi:superinfection immunity protein [Notoacmeibacter ruber]|uniref:Superinfection immunity protein n=2 Tax=Notoacmeibacter ruber TaxID=2670375 RepID=A0A3L7JFQ2_9HYPH|nr:superinfection immunity protein [Notoacmeibacter ruber]
MMIGGVILLMIVVTPIVIAFIRRHPNRWAIFIITVVFGFTLLGWLIALIWSLHGFHRSEGPLRDGGESGLNLFGNDTHVVGSALFHDARSAQPRVPARTYAAAFASQAGLAHQIERLLELKAKGAISDQEYTQLKADLMRA